jgi:hypothetical protein
MKDRPRQVIMESDREICRLANSNFTAGRRPIGGVPTYSGKSLVER